jgi:hypothetical protein
VINRGWAALLVWAAMLAGLTAIQFIFSTSPYYWATLGGAALATALFAGYFLWRPPLRGDEYVPESSYGTVAAATGFAVAVAGVPFGPWLWLPGLGLLAVGIGGVVNELRVERRQR